MIMITPTTIIREREGRKQIMYKHGVHTTSYKNQMWQKLFSKMKMKRKKIKRKYQKESAVLVKSDDEFILMCN